MKESQSFDECSTERGLLKPYFLVTMQSDDAPTPSDQTIEDYKSKCDSCGYQRYNGSLKPIKLADSPSDIPISFVSNIAIPLLGIDFLESIGSDLIDTHFWKGEILDQSLELIPGFLAIFPKDDKLILRGNKRSAFRWCSKCGAIVYLPQGKKYGVASDFKLRKPIYLTSVCSFVVREDVWERIASRKFQCISSTRLDIRPNAIDGMPNDLTLTPPNHSQNQWKG